MNLCDFYEGLPNSLEMYDFSLALHNDEDTLIITGGSNSQTNEMISFRLSDSAMGGNLSYER